MREGRREGRREGGKEVRREGEMRRRREGEEGKKEEEGWREGGKKGRRDKEKKGRRGRKGLTLSLAVANVCYHLTESKEMAKLQRTFASLPFLFRRAINSQIFDFVEDFNHAENYQKYAPSFFVNFS
jgi:hypothetical protein